MQAVKSCSSSGLSMPFTRWLLKQDMEEVLAIEGASFGCSWRECDFVEHLRRRNTIGLVAEHDGVVAGYVIYSLYRSRIDLNNFAVHPKYRRLGIGTSIIDVMKNKLSQQRRKRLFSITDESNLRAQLFFKANGFLAKSILTGYFIDRERIYPASDGILMVHRP